MPELSIVTVCYNDSEGLNHTLESCLAIRELAGLSFEHIVVDSSPAAHAPVLSDPRFTHVKTIPQVPPQGIYPAINLGCEAAKGTWQWHLNAGDALRDAQALRNALTCHPETDLVFTPVFQGLKAEDWLVTPIDLNFRHNLLGINKVQHQGCLIKTKSFRQLGGFDTTYRIAADYDFFVRVENSDLTTVCHQRPFAWFAFGGASQKRVFEGLRETRQIARKLSLCTDERLRASLIYWSHHIGFALLSGTFRHPRLHARVRQIANGAKRLIFGAKRGSRHLRAL